MSTLQIVGIAAASVIVLLLVIALVVTRKGGTSKEASAAEEQPAEAQDSFLDSPPSDTFAKLGSPEHEPAAAEGQTEAPPIVMTPTGVAAAAPGVDIDWERGRVRPEPVTPEPEPVTAPPPTAEPEAEAEEGETTGEMPAVAAAEPVTEALADETAAPRAVEEQAVEEQAAPQGSPPDEAPREETPPEAAPEEAPPEAAPPSAAAAAGTPSAAEAAEPAAAEPAASAESGRLVPLSSIIVTTSTKMVDLENPEIRRMLTDLVTFEIDQATQYREQGQNLDAVLQLTEAEKICRALGKHDTAHEIRQMMKGLEA